jgi:hypothetical protein
MVAALAREMSLPSERRRWQGRMFGVPYSFRVPTPERILNAYWNSDDPRLFTERVFGVGWAVNLPQAQWRMERVFRRLAGTTLAFPGPRSDIAAAAGQAPSRALTNSSARP